MFFFNQRRKVEDDGVDFDDKRLVGMICERLRPDALEVLNKVGKSDAQMEPCRIRDILLTSANVFCKHYKSDKIRLVFAKFQ